MKVAFAGTPEFAATVLRGLISSRHEVGLVVSQPDRPKGRGRKTAPTPVAEAARAAGVPLAQPERIGEVADGIAECDALVVAAYGQILRPDTLHAAPRGAWNVHASLLPRWRGAAPVERAIIVGDRETGVTIIEMDEGLDTGRMAIRQPVPIGPEITGGELRELLAETGAKAMVEVLESLDAGTVKLTEQDSDGATYAPKLSGEDLEIRWTAAARRVHDLVRALSPQPGARAFHPDVRGPIKLLRTRIVEGGHPEVAQAEIAAEGGRLFVGAADGAVEVLELQMPGARRLPAADLLRGYAIAGSFRA